MIERVGQKADERVEDDVGEMKPAGVAGPEHIIEEEGGGGEGPVIPGAVRPGLPEVRDPELSQPPKPGGACVRRDQLMIVPDKAGIEGAGIDQETKGEEAQGRTNTQSRPFRPAHGRVVISLREGLAARRSHRKT
jgi:hypothetical protein